MSKKTATSIIIIVVLLVVLGFLVFYFYSNQGQGNNVAGTTPQGSIFPSNPVPTGTQNPTGATTGTTATQPTTNGTRVAPVLKELSTRPAAGAVAFATSSPDSPFVHFIERGTGNVYEVAPANSTERRLSNTTIPKIEEALWNGAGTTVIARYSGDGGDSIKTYSASLVAPKSGGQTEGTLVGAFLTDNITAVAKNPDQNKLFYLLPNSVGSTGIVSEFDGTRRNQIFDSPLSDFLVDWPTPTLVALTTKPSAGVPGVLFLLNTKTGVLTEAISGVNGLTASVSPTGNLALYSESAGQSVSLKIYSFKDGSTQETAVSTLPEKCVWSKNDPTVLYCSVPSYLPAGNYPDDWYKGVVSFSDDIWKIDSATGAGKLLARLKQNAGQDIDGTNLFTSPKEDYLFFTDKKDFHLWSLRLLP